MNKEYTVVLLRPEYLSEETDEEYGQDIYVALVSSENIRKAIQIAQKEAYDADIKEDLKPKSAEDYKLCVMFEGTHNPTFFGWQL